MDELMFILRIQPLELAKVDNANEIIVLRNDALLSDQIENGALIVISKALPPES